MKRYYLVILKINIFFSNLFRRFNIIYFLIFDLIKYIDFILIIFLFSRLSSHYFMKIIDCPHCYILLIAYQILFWIFIWNCSKQSVFAAGCILDFRDRFLVQDFHVISALFFVFNISLSWIECLLSELISSFLLFVILI